MTIPREVILDLLPLYLAGEASPATRALVEDELRGDPELARKVAADGAHALARIAPPAPPPELELRSLRRTRRLLAAQRWLFAVGASVTLSAFSTQFRIAGGRLEDAHFLLRGHPALFAGCLLAGLSCFAAYGVLRRRRGRDAGGPQQGRNQAR
jgi:anti-sigma factor RsiW